MYLRVNERLHKRPNRAHTHKHAHIHKKCSRSHSRLLFHIASCHESSLQVNELMINEPFLHTKYAIMTFCYYRYRPLNIICCPFNSIDYYYIYFFVINVFMERMNMKYGGWLYVLCIGNFQLYIHNWLAGCQAAWMNGFVLKNKNFTVQYIGDNCVLIRIIAKHVAF